ncbi:hypothetical protein [Nocardia sp. NPDC050717]|uniref:hypothetical protein n=1 Tax=Nocardia sp. NPDC050717 TaxID=3157221 RepID=UPI0033F42113
MKPQWEQSYDPDLDPAVEAAARRVDRAIADLDTASLQVASIDVHAILSTPTVVTEEFMANLAAVPGMSAELYAYAERVRAGECRWSEIESCARPVPPEVVDLKASPQFVWNWSLHDSYAQPTSPLAGPAYFDDDEEENQMPDSWLE